MYNSAAYIMNDLMFQRRLRDRYTVKKRQLPEGRLSAMKVKGHTYYIKITGECREYLGNGKHRQVQLLQKKYFLKASIKRIDANIALMEDFIQRYQTIDPNLMLKSFPNAYRALPQTCFDSAGAVDIDGWGREEYNKSDKYAEGLVHKTIKGDKVRSKSEMVIANALQAYKIPYRYEEVLQLPDVTIVPDFKVLMPRKNEFKIWEHFGMISNQRYREGCIWKIEKYIENGFYPWRDLIFTFDDENGNLDGSIIDSIIETFLLK